MKISTAIAPRLGAGIENMSRAISQYPRKTKRMQNEGTTVPRLEVFFFFFLRESGARAC